MTRLSTTVRLAALSAFIIFAANLTCLALLYGGLRDDAVAHLRQQVEAQDRDLLAAYQAGGSAALTAAIDDLQQSGDPAVVALLFRPDGRLMTRAGPAFAPPPAHMATGFAYMHIGAGGRGPEIAYALHPVGRDLLLSGRIVDYSQQIQRALERAVLLSALLSALLGIGGAFVIAIYVSRRLRHISTVVDSAGAGDLGRRVDWAGSGDAFDELGRRVNMMLDRIARLLDELRLITDSFAHDLRGPLARLRTKVERAAALAGDPAASASMDQALAETDILLRMLATLLQISRAEAGIAASELPLVDPAGLLTGIAELYEPVAQESGIELLTDIVTGLPPARLHHDLMSQAISNLIDNALRYGEGGRILLALGRVDAAEQDGRACFAFCVTDSGPGIDAADMEVARRRFGRLDRARSKSGAGLGLALVDAVARFHGGELLLEDACPGLKARIVLPFPSAPRN